MRAGAVTPPVRQQAAVEATLRAVAPSLLGYFLRRVPSPEDAADLVGETLAAAWRSAARMPREAEQARMWMFGVARNVLRHHHRSGSRRTALAERLAVAVRLAQSAATARGIDDEAIEVRMAVEALPERLAELIRLVHWDGCTIEEAAALLGVPASTARSRHARAKQLLRDRLSVPTG